MTLPPLVIGLLSDDPAWLAALEGVPRVRVVRLATAPRPLLAESRVVDVVLADGDDLRPRALALKAAGRRVVGAWTRRSGDGFLDAVVDLQCHGDGRSLVPLLAAAAGRPGAGLTGGPPVSVVATVLDEQATIGRLVGAVGEQLGPDDEFVVVDGGSSDETFSILRDDAARDPRIIALQAPGTNISEGRNVGIRRAFNDVIATTDAGCRPEAQWLEALRAAFAEPDPPGLAAGNASVIATTPFERAQALACYPDPLETRWPDLLTRLYGKCFGTVFDPTLPFARSLAFSRDAWEAAGRVPRGPGVD